MLEDTDKPATPSTPREYVAAYPDMKGQALVELAAKNGHKFTRGAINSAQHKAKTAKRAKPKPKPAASDGMTSADCIRSFPIDMPTDELIRLAKARYGVTVTKGSVYTCRSGMRAMKGTRRPVKKHAGHSHAGHSHAKESRSSREYPMGAVKDFVSRYPNMRAQDVVEIARREGMNLSLQQVYRSRSYQRATSQLPLLPAGPTDIAVRHKPAPGRRVIAGDGDDERALRSAIVRRGVDWARQIVNDAEQRLLATLEGIGE